MRRSIVSNLVLQSNLVQYQKVYKKIKVEKYQDKYSVRFHHITF